MSETKIRIHLAGRDPVSGISFHPEIGITDHFWENANGKRFEELKAPRTVASSPRKDIESLEEANKGRMTRSLEALEFILEKTDYNEAEADPVGKHTMGPKGEASGPSYNISLRLLERLATLDLIWFGIKPEIRYTEVWKPCWSLPEDELEAPAPPTEKLASRKDVRCVLGTEIRHFSGIPEFGGSLRIFDEMGVSVSGREWLLPDTEPFVAVHMTETMRDYNCGEEAEALGNAAFLQLIESAPQKAEEAYRKAVLDLFHYQIQSEDQNYYDSDMFLQETDTEIHLLASPSSAHRKTLKKAQAALLWEAKKVIASYVPTLADPLRQHERGLVVHIKRFTLTKNDLELEATVETRRECHKLALKGGLMHCESTARKGR